jgi:hypothetical protein
MKWIWRLLLSLLLVGLSAPAWAQGQSRADGYIWNGSSWVPAPGDATNGLKVNTFASSLTAFAHEELTIGAAATPFTAATYTNATYATFICKTSSATINVLNDGGTPTSTVGQSVAPGLFVTVQGATNIANFLGIRTGALSAVCAVQYYR